MSPILGRSLKKRQDCRLSPVLWTFLRSSVRCSLSTPNRLFDELALGALGWRSKNHKSKFTFFGETRQGQNPLRCIETRGHRVFEAYIFPRLHSPVVRFFEGLSKFKILAMISQ